MRATRLTALHLASTEGHTDVVEVLLRRRADIHVTDMDGQTALHVAAREGHADVAQLLLAYQARIDARTHARRTPLHLAVREGQIDVIKLLLNSRADINVVDEHGLTPLHFAARFGYINTTKLLLRHNADIEVRDKSGKTALDHASSPAVQALLTERANAVIDRTHAPYRTPTARKESSSSGITIVAHSTRKHSRARVESAGAAAASKGLLTSKLTSTGARGNMESSRQATEPQPLLSPQKTSRVDASREKKLSQADVVTSTRSGSHVRDKTSRQRTDHETHHAKARVPAEDRQG